MSHPTNQSSLHARSDTVPGVALAKAESRKKTKFQRLAEANNHNFIPMAFEGPSGRMADAVKTTISTLIKAAANAKGINYSIMSNYWMRRLSVKFQIYHARIYVEKISAIADTRNRRQGFNAIDESELIYNDRIFLHGAERVAESGL